MIGGASAKDGLRTQLFITKDFVIAVMIFLFVIFFGLGGGFIASFNLGSFALSLTKIIASIPLWFWLVVAGIWLINQFRR